MARKSWFSKIRQKRNLARKKQLRKLRSGNGSTIHRFSLTGWLVKVFCYTLILSFFLLAAAFLFPDQLLRFCITVVGSKVTGCRISLDKIELSLSRGDLKIINLKIANPDRFTPGDLLSADSIYCAVETETLFSDRTVFREVEIRNLHLNPEINEQGELNFLVAAKNLPGYLRSPEKTSKKTDFSIENLSLTNVILVTGDFREENNIDGFSISFNSLNGNSKSGTATLHGLQMIPSHRYRQNQLEVTSALLKFRSDTGNSVFPVIQNCEINGVKTKIGIKGRERDSLYNIFETFKHFFPSANTDFPSEAPLEIHDFTIRDAAVTLRDELDPRSITAKFSEFHGSLSKGDAVMKNFTVSSMRNRHSDLLTIANAGIQFDPASIFSGEIMVHKFDASDIHSTINIYAKNNSDVRELFDTIENSIYPADQSPDDDPDDDTILKVDSFELRNGSLSIRDLRDKNENSGDFDAKFHRIHGSWDKGTLAVQKLEVSAPGTQDIKILTLASAEFEFIPESLTSAVTRIKKIDFSGINAVAILEENRHTVFRNIADALQALLAPFYSGNLTTTAEKDAASGIIVDNYTMTDSQVSLKDRRKNENVSGMSCVIEKLHFSRNAGTFDLQNVKIFNPSSYTTAHLMTLTSVNAVFKPETEIKVLDDLKVDNLHVNMEFKTNGKNNIHECADALCTLIAGKDFDCRKISAPEKAQISADPQPAMQIKKFSLGNSSFSVVDAKHKVPVKVPLAQNLQDVKFESSGGGDLTTSIHSAAVELEEECKDIADPSKLFLEQLDKTAVPGIKQLQDFFKSSGTVMRKLMTPFNQ